MPLRALPVVFAALVGLCGCLGRLTSAPPPTYYEIEFPTQKAGCGTAPGKGLRVWAFSAPAPFNREEMIVLETGREVRLSNLYRWVAAPGSMVADKLIRDLSLSGLFEKVVSAGDPFHASLELGGQVFKFAWERQGSSGRAVLDVEVSLWAETPQRDILFREHYHLESEPEPEGGSEVFARAMSELVARLSAQVQQDLCTKLKDSSSPAAG